MFPTFKVSITGLEPTSRYIVYMDVVPVDYHRYKYHSSQWIVTGAAEPHCKSKITQRGETRSDLFRLVSGRFYPHPDSNSTGAELMKQPLSFSKLKLTNNATDQNGHVSHSRWRSEMIGTVRFRSCWIQCTNIFLDCILSLQHRPSMATVNSSTTAPIMSIPSSFPKHNSSPWRLIKMKM